MDKLKKIIPQGIKQKILKTIDFINIVITYPFCLFGFSASFFYFIVSRRFDREHRAVLLGRIAYWKSLKKLSESSALLRRNIHRLEKGLIMEPRRPIFAEKYISETVDIYCRALDSNCLDASEKKWFTDVLKKYFSVVQDSKNISEARKLFGVATQNAQTASENESIPYQYKDMPALTTSYEDLLTLCTRRRSVRWYEDREVPLDLINQAVNLASLAPSACNRQPYKFYVSSNKEKAVEIGKCAGGTKGFASNFPCVIAVVGDLSCYPYERDRHLVYIDASLASMQLMLSFDTLGLASCPINWPDVESAEKKLNRLLNLKYYQRPIMLISVGYPKKEGGIPYSQKKNAQHLIKHV